MAIVAVVSACHLAAPYQSHSGPPSAKRDGATLALDTSLRDAAPSDMAALDRAVTKDVEVATDTGVDLSSCPGAPCPLGCNGANTRCYRLGASNSLGIDEPIFNAVNKRWTVADGTASIDTDTGKILDGSGTPIRSQGDRGRTQNGVYWNLRPQPGYDDLSVFALAFLDVPSASRIEVHGSKPLALYVTEGAKIAGTLVAVVGAPNRKSPGAGGYAGGTRENDGASCSGGEGAAGSEALGRSSGGGGGGRISNGANGGKGGSVLGGAGGDAVPASGGEALVPLFGGCGGGGGGGGSQDGEGGGGGGALQISVNGMLEISGLVNVPGAGGRGGWAIGSSAGGGGGGAGGAILLEATRIVVSGRLAANGGAGGGADCAGGTNGEDGEDGQMSTVSARGGICVGAGCSMGGAGGAVNQVEGLTPADANTCGGGGGGAAGRIRVNAPDPTAQIEVGKASASPAPSMGTVGRW